MRLAYSSNAYAEFTVSEAIDRIADLGYRGLELMADEPHLWPATTTDEDIAAVRHRVRKNRLSISNVNAFMMNAVGDIWHPSWIEPDSESRRLRARHTVDALTMADKLGARSVSTEPGGPLAPAMSREAAMELFASELTPVLRHAERVDVMLLVEPEPGLLIETADQFLELAARVDSPMFGLNLDIGHFYCVAEQLPNTVKRLQHLTRHYHIEDIAATRLHEHLIPGHGAIDFEAVLQAIRETRYDGWLTVELYPYHDDPDGAGREAAGYLKQLMHA